MVILLGVLCCPILEGLVGCHGVPNNLTWCCVQVRIIQSTMNTHHGELPPPPVARFYTDNQSNANPTQARGWGGGG